MANEFKIDLVQGRVVSWYATSQSAGAQSLTIKAPSGQTVVNTSILSTSLSNISVGSFTAGQTGQYTVGFPADKDVRQDTATITNSQGDTICQTYQFGAEDSTDGDYNDMFVAITWYRNKG